MRTVIFSLGLLASLCACVADDRYFGVDVGPGAAPTELRAMALRAQAGDKQAQFELGTMFEQGRGVPPDCRRAVQLYRQAAAPSGGTSFIYRPSTGKNADGRLIPLPGGPRKAGLRAAQDKLALIARTGKACD